MKSVLLSIKPKYCELIASGEKTVEIRKNRPKIDVPFKVYIYCTKPKEYVSEGGCYVDELYKMPNGAIKCGCSMETTREYYMNTYNGKIIGEFICDNIGSFYVFQNGQIDNWSTGIRQACLSEDEIISYVGNGKMGHCWHISDLVIYDKPKELSEFCKPCVDEYSYCEGCRYGHIKYPEWVETAEDLEGISYDIYCLNRVQRPPQSWCYVEEVENG